ncbi:MAG: hypothetical protein EGQ34_00125 [Sutterella sp.]|nr:hypothetical protein [Sutterella sp.]
MLLAWNPDQAAAPGDDGMRRKIISFRSAFLLRSTDALFLQQKRNHFFSLSRKNYALKFLEMDI